MQAYVLVGKNVEREQKYVFKIKSNFKYGITFYFYENAVKKKEKG